MRALVQVPKKEVERKAEQIRRKRRERRENPKTA
jgi:hypothetical protein